MGKVEERARKLTAPSNRAEVDRRTGIDGGAELWRDKGGDDVPRWELRFPAREDSSALEKGSWSKRTSSSTYRGGSNRGRGWPDGEAPWQTRRNYDYGVQRRLWQASRAGKLGFGVRARGERQKRNWPRRALKRWPRHGHGDAWHHRRRWRRAGEQ